MEITIRIAKDFTNAPAGKFEKDGEFSGEFFRKKFLEPLVSDVDITKIIINLDNLDGVSCSFWNEAFNLDTSKIEFVCSDDAKLAEFLKTNYTNSF
jgi:hypothetical protein